MQVKDHVVPSITCSQNGQETEYEFNLCNHRILVERPRPPLSPGLRELAVNLPVAYHLACKVQVGCRWILVDATWDPPLAKAGFLVHDHWHGYSETKCAVKPLTLQVQPPFNNPKKIESCYRIRDEEFCAPDSEKNYWNDVDRARYYHKK